MPRMKRPAPPPISLIGRTALRELTAQDVRHALTVLAEDRSSATAAFAHNALTRAIRHAEARDLIRRNVSAPADTPRGSSADRPSRSILTRHAGSLR